MTPEEARATGLPLAIGSGADVDDDRPEQVNAPVATPAEPAPLPSGNIPPETPPAPAIVPEREQPPADTFTALLPAQEPLTAQAPLVAAAPDPAAEEQKLADAKALLQSHGLVVHDAFPAQPSGHCAAVRAVIASWNLTKCFNNFVKGFRTLIFFGASCGLGLTDAFDGIDIQDLLQRLLGGRVKVGAIIVALSVAGIALRLVTKSPAFASWQKGAKAGNDGLAPGVGSGSVDEPA